jgi:hypothetical protein
MPENLLPWLLWVAAIAVGASIVLGWTALKVGVSQLRRAFGTVGRRPMSTSVLAALLVVAVIVSVYARR